jgi:ankyrin repeat protein
MSKPSKTALFKAASAWDAPAVAALLSAAPELAETVDQRGRTALHLACSVKPGGLALGEDDGTRTVAALLKGGCDLEAVAFSEGEWKANAVWFAVARGENLPLVKFLLKRGGDPSYSTWACVWRDDDVMLREVLRHKPRLDWLAEGETPIFWAARLQRLKTLDLLIKAGADPNIRDVKGRDAVEIAKARKLPKEIIARLEKLAAERRGGRKRA